jgi:hypothetical protein
MTKEINLGGDAWRKVAIYKPEIIYKYREPKGGSPYEIKQPFLYTRFGKEENLFAEEEAS